MPDTDCLLDERGGCIDPRSCQHKPMPESMTTDRTSEALARVMERIWPGWLEEAPGTDEAREEMRDHAEALLTALAADGYHLARPSEPPAVTEETHLAGELGTCRFGWHRADCPDAILVQPESAVTEALIERLARWHHDLIDMGHLRSLSWDACDSQPWHRAEAKAFLAATPESGAAGERER